MPSERDTDLTPSRPDAVLASNEYDIITSPRVSTPTRTINGFTVSSSGRVNPGDDLFVDVTAPDSDPNHDNYVIDVYNVAEQVRGYKTPSDDGTAVFDTGSIAPNDIELDAGTFGTAVNHDDDSGEFRDAHPFVVKAYETTTHVQDVLESGDDLPVAAELDPVAGAAERDIESVEAVVWQDGDSGTRTEMTKVDDLQYEVTITDPPTTEFFVQTIVFSPVYDDPDVDRESVGISDANSVTAAQDTLQLQGSSTAGGAQQFAAPDVDSERVFTGGLTPTVTALQQSDVPTDSAPDWTFDREGALSDSSPVEDGGLVYVGSGGGVVYALDATTGGIDWTYPTDETSGESAITSSPRVANGTVYVGANDGTVRALDASSGAQSWKTTVDGPVYSRPAVGTDRVFVTTADGTLVAIDKATATTDWSYDLGVDLGSSSPTVVAGTVYVAADGLYAFSVSGDQPSWTVGAIGATGAVRPVVDNGLVYVGSRDGNMYAVDPGTQSVSWSYRARDAIVSTATVVDGRIVVGSLDGSVYVIDGNTGDLRTAEYVGTPVRNPPAVAGGTVYVPLPPGDGSEWTVAALDINTP